MARRRRTLTNSRVKRGTFITSRPSGYTPNHWPSTLSPFKPLKPYTRYVVKSYIPDNRAVYRPLAAGQLTRRPRRSYAQPVSGMHDTPFKRPQISPYGVWQKGLGYLLPPTVKVCVQRKQRREALFATTGGGSIRRKSTNQRTLRSQIGCK